MGYSTVLAGFHLNELLHIGLLTPLMTHLSEALAALSSRASPKCIELASVVGTS